MTSNRPEMRPANCRFRLRDEGKPYPRSGCRACGATIGTGLGDKCTRVPNQPLSDKCCKCGGSRFVQENTGPKQPCSLCQPLSEGGGQ